MSLSPFGRSKLKIDRRRRPRPDEATLENFSGGLNVIENDLRISTNESKVEINVHRDQDGTKSIRWGTKLFANISSAVAGNIIDIVYFQNKLVAFTADGEIATIADDGTVVAIWNNTIAGALPGAPTGWSTGLVTIDTTEFRNELVCCNGIDKPILIATDHTVTYLQDLATGSNVNTPIGRYVTTVGNYTVIAGVAATPDVIYISNTGTSGTWPSDPAPNDAISINIAAYAPQQGGRVRALSSFRNFLVVHFATSSVVITLGQFNSSGVHTPDVLDTLPDHGAISHRTITVIDTDIIYADHIGVYKANRNVFGNALEGQKLSAKVQPLFTADAPIAEANRWKSFSVHNVHENRIMFFLYDGTEYSVYAMAYAEGLKPNKVSWSKLSGWDFVAGTNSVRGRVFLCKGSKIFQYGNSVFDGEDYTGDFIDEFDSNWATTTAYSVDDRVYESVNDKVYICLVAHTSGTFADDLASDFWEEYKGDEIAFDWEMPWSDINTRLRKKRISYIGIDTVGTAAFTIELYVDNIRVDSSNNDDPALSLDFVAGGSPGYGGGEQPYGGGRRAADERLWGFPCEFKLLKIRIKGSSNKRLAFVSISFLIVRGTYKR